MYRSGCHSGGRSTGFSDSISFSDSDSETVSMIHSPAQLPALNNRFDNAHPRIILDWVLRHYDRRLAIVTSFQPTGIVTLHLLHEMIGSRGLSMPDVLTLDTGHLFDESLALMDALEERLDLHLIRVRPALTVEEQAQMYGPALWERCPDLCCHLRKVEPLRQALNDYDAWLTGLRRDQSRTRQTTPVFGWEGQYDRLKVAPLVTWNEDMIWTYIHAHDLPYNPLHDRGFPSIGCAPCTQPVSSHNGDKRAGRWSNRPKTECGIHSPSTT